MNMPTHRTGGPVGRCRGEGGQRNERVNAAPYNNAAVCYFLFTYEYASSRVVASYEYI